MHGWLIGTHQRSFGLYHRNKNSYNFGKCSRGRSQGVPKIFRAPIYRAHCAVIFAIAQLSCFVVSSERRVYVTSAYSRSRSIQGQPRSLILVPIESTLCDFLNWSDLVPICTFRRYGRVKVENRQFVYISLYLPQSHFKRHRSCW